MSAQARTIVLRCCLFCLVCGGVIFCIVKGINQVSDNEQNYRLTPDGGQIGTTQQIDANLNLASQWFHASSMFFWLGVGMLGWWAAQWLWRKKRAEGTVGFDVVFPKDRE